MSSTTCEATDPFHLAGHGFRDHLVSAGPTARRRARRASRLRSAITASAGMLAVSVTALAVTVGSQATPAAAALSISVNDGQVIVVSDGQPLTQDGVISAFEAAGVDVQVSSVPTGPSLQGRFASVVVGSDQSGPTAQVVGADGRPALRFSVPAGVPLKLTVTRPAQPGEPYGVFPDATSPGEPLPCLALVGASATQIDSLVGPYTAAGVHVAIQPHDAHLDGEVVAMAFATSASSVEVLICPGDPKPQIPFGC